MITLAVDEYGRQMFAFDPQNDLHIVSPLERNP